MANICVHGFLALIGLAALYGFGVGVVLGGLVTLASPDRTPESRSRHREPAAADGRVTGESSLSTSDRGVRP